MFKSLGVAKGLILLIAFALTFFAIDHHRPVQINHGYLSSFSFFPGESSKLYLNSLSNNRKAVFRLFDNDSLKVDSTRGEALIQHEPEDAYSRGFSFKLSAEYTLPPRESGFYFWDHFLPFISKNKSARIIIIFPFLDRQCLSNSGGKSFLDYNSENNKASTVLSTNRPLYIDKDSRDFFRWIKSNLNSSQYSFATDQDMETLTDQFPKADLLIFYGNSRFWSIKQIESFTQFIQKGGNALIMGSVVMIDRVRHDPDQMSIEYYSEAGMDKTSNEIEKATRINYKNAPYFNYEKLGMDYEFGGSIGKEGSRWGGFRICTKDNPLLMNTGLENGNIILLKSFAYSGSPVLKSTEIIPVIDKKKIRFENAELIAFDRTEKGFGMIAAFQKAPGSGYIVNIGSSEWVAPENLKVPVISQITKNAIKILSEGRSPFTAKPN